MRHRVLSLLIAATSIACSEKTLSPERAASLIAGLEGFKRDAHVAIHVGVPFRSVSRCLGQAEVERMPLNRFVVDRGWVRYEMREAIVGLGMKASCPALAMTPTGEAASAQWSRGRAARNEGAAWAVPIGRREILGVTRLTTAPDESIQAEFDWKWTPHETGKALETAVPNAKAFFGETRKGRASCRRSDEGWRCQLGMWTTPADVLGEFSP